MQEGGRYRFSMPQRLAFTNGSPPGLPKDSDLTFEVQVRKIVRGGAAMMAVRPCQPATALSPTPERSLSAARHPLRRPAVAEIDQRHLQGRENGIGEENAEDPE